MSDRANSFDSLDDFTVKRNDKGPVPTEAIDAVAESAGFLSRTVRGEGPPNRGPSIRRIHRTGRTAQLNVRATPDTMDRFYALADRHNVTLAVLLEMAVDALEKASSPKA